MNIDVTQIAPAFEVSFGDDGDGIFAAVMWPQELGDPDFQGNIIAVAANNGFVLFGDADMLGVGFLGVSQEVLNQILSSSITIMHFVGEDYETYEVFKTISSGDVSLNFI
ncbi:hypothetical protein [Pseudomonas putida]|uniref:Uncharacterized protein n=1 Tax=Pseudomonas putida TaxID=303 RepID=A0A8I1JIS9_PSEPU|nr:hypothetical protein [Pseudomonas putida]MBI6882864.1 hypothetical protein [Pseudomonas putida]